MVFTEKQQEMQNHAKKKEDAENCNSCAMKQLSLIAYQTKPDKQALTHRLLRNGRRKQSSGNFHYNEKVFFLSASGWRQVL